MLVSIASGVLSILFQLKNSHVIYDQQDIALGNWAMTNTKTSDIFIIDPVPNHPIPGLSGRLVYSGYPGHLWVHGIDYSERETLNRSVIEGDLVSNEKAKLPISYVVLSKNGSENNRFNYQVVFKNNKYTVFKNLASKIL